MTETYSVLWQQADDLLAMYRESTKPGPDQSHVASYRTPDSSCNVNCAANLCLLAKPDLAH